MATRSTIALEFADSTVQQVYAHWDGYLDHNGRILQDHYLDPFKLRDLIDLGDLSTLGAEIGEKRPFDNPHKWGTPDYEAFSAQYKNQCLFYNRDRGEDLRVQKFKDFADYEQNHQYEEYEYILRQIDGQAIWFVSAYNTSGYQPLASLLALEAA
jgi:hypothetical protein